MRILGVDPGSRILGYGVVEIAGRDCRYVECGVLTCGRDPRMERRLAMAAQFAFEGGVLDVVATHLALGDRTRHRQVRSLLDHPRFSGGPTLLIGDMNAWRDCKATRALEDELHNNLQWPPSFPAARPVLALDRIYARGVEVRAIDTHRSSAARSASDHLPVVAQIELPSR